VRPAALTLAALCAGALSGCADTLQDQPISHSLLERAIVAPQPVYWLGGSFRGLAVTDVVRDPGGAFTIQYGDCVQGGQATCVPPLRVVSSPDNSFVPGGSGPRAAARLREVDAVVAQGGRTIEIPTGEVVVDVFAKDRRLAVAAARTLVPINRVGAPEAALPAPAPDSGFGNTPLPSQVPSPLRELR
jgi:hypothetical protein